MRIQEVSATCSERKEVTWDTSFSDFLPKKGEDE